MNNNTFFNPNLSSGSMPGSPLYVGNSTVPNQETAPYIMNQASSEQNYIENVLKRTNRLKITVYATFPDSNEWRDLRISGILEGSGRDHVVISDPVTGKWLIIPIIYIDYFEFDENLTNYLRTS